ncbi:hypothetical protein [Pontibacter fetidus]|uniref:Apea-like HEPN domain-containing protein n=1 Tax=Pontibacter fetidus TaxID=2700082 RepID=A0A6B2HAP5_9BACT|nr:hypothetical protein [Pontibacter fetidus]NDK56822.1 hypothetical protein [Pontibacter fetidus]
MQKINLDYSVNPFQKLFIEKGIELLYRNTIDSFRLRLHNPKTLIEELIQVTYSSISGILTNNDYVESTSKELKQALEDNNDGLLYKQINKKHYLEILNKADRNNYKLLIQSSKLILKDNLGYDAHLFDEVNNLMNSYDSLIDSEGALTIKESDFFSLRKKIVVFTNHLFVELINKGYTKQYLYNLFQIVFVRKKGHSKSFEERFNIYKELAQKADEEFTVVFNIKGSTFQFQEFYKIDNSYGLITKKFRKAIEKKTSNQVNEYLEKHKGENLIYIKIHTKDYFKAIEIALNRVSKDLDIYHLGFSKHIFRIDERCAVIGENEPQKASTFPSNFQIDGYFRSDASIFENLLIKIKKIEQNNIGSESYNKILSAIRYYRTGSESPELETKLLNYWIGLEYIFTTTNSAEKTIDRIRKYFPKCHSLIYVKRNLFDYHKALSRQEINGHISNYDDNLNYLLLHKSYRDVIVNSESELLKFRTNFFQKWYEEPNKINEVLIKHQHNITSNITRLYRIRNEIVHNAAIKNGIYVHISHIKYYLTFILNSILDFMAENNVDLDNDGKVTIEDYFIAQEIILGSLKNSKLEEFLKINNPTQILH